MKKAEFELLTIDEKANLLHINGIFLGKVHTKKGITVFFQIEGFYAAVHYLVYRICIATIHCYDTTDILDPFLSEIDIEELINQ